MSAPDTGTAGISSPPVVAVSAKEIAAVAQYARGRFPSRAGVARTNWLAARLGMPGAPPAALVDYAYRHGHLTAQAPHAAPELPPLLVTVLECLAKGLGTRAISTHLGISRSTAREYRRRLLHTLGVASPARAVAIGWETGLLRPDTTHPHT